MAIRIPQYQQTQTSQGAETPLPSQGGSQVTRAVGQLGEAVTGFAENAIRTEELYRQKQERDGEVEARRILAETEYATALTQQNYFRDLSGDPTGAAARFNEVLTPTFEAITKKQTEDANANPYVMKHLEPGLQKIRQQAFLKSMGAEAALKQDWFKVQIADTESALAKSVAIDPTKWAEKVAHGIETIDLSGLPAADKQLAKAAMASRITVASFDKQIQANPKDALSILNNADDPRTKSLSADDHRVLVSRAGMELEQQKRAAEAAERRRLAEAEHYGSMYIRAMEDGRPVSAEDSAIVMAKVRGTPVEAVVREVTEQAPEIQRIVNLPLAEGMAELSKMQKDIESGDMSGAKTAKLARLSRALIRNQKAYDDDPIAADAAANGYQIDPLPSNFGEIGGVLATRIADVSAINSKRGSDYVVTLTNAEADSLGRQLKGMASTERVRALAAIRNGMNDDVHFQGTVKQMFGDDPNAYASAVAFGMGLKTSAGRPVGLMIEQGAQMLKDKTLIKAKEGGDDGTKSAFDAIIGTALVPASPDREAAYKSSLAVYAFLAAENEKLGQTLDGPLFKQAVNIATGGVIRLASSDSSILAPTYGADEDDVSDLFDDQLRKVAKANGYNYDSVKSLRVVQDNKNPSRFYIADDTLGNYLSGKDKRPMVVDLSAPISGQANPGARYR